jgi:hypothetical protein
VECRTIALGAALDAERLGRQLRKVLQRSQIVRELDVVVDARTRSLMLTGRVEAAQTPQLAAVMAANELLRRTNRYCGEEPVGITHLVSQLAGA